MGCESCSNKTSQPKGCRNNGYCATDGCNKLSSYNWLIDMDEPNGQEPFKFVEVRFKNGRKVFYKKSKDLTLLTGDIVVLSADMGYDVGVVSLTGELVRLQMHKKKVSYKGESLNKVIRKASQKDIDIWELARNLEEPTRLKAREIAKKHMLKMKISDVEIQGDNKKAIFYYTAEQRVDFRLLIKEYASTFKIKIEMKQVGYRQEASRVGGIGSCGRELCCSTWLTDFRAVNTSAARYQQLSINPQKLTGQCGKLKCCLNYELDLYMEILKNFPKTNIKLKTKRGLASFQKMDIFNKILWYKYEEDSSGQWIELSADKVNEIITKNKEGEKPNALEDYEEIKVEKRKLDYENVVGQDSLTRFDKKSRQKKRRSIHKKNKPFRGHKKDN